MPAALTKCSHATSPALVEGVAVADVLRDGAGGVGGVTTADGRTVRCRSVVNCAGMWARQLGARAGVCAPNQAAEHYYLLTEPMADVGAGWPVVEDPSRHTYIRPEGGGLMVG